MNGALLSACSTAADICTKKWLNKVRLAQSALTHPKVLLEINYSAGALQEIGKGSTPQYGAIVFDDDVGARITDAFKRGLNVTTQPGDSPPGNSTLDAYSLYAKLLGASPEGR